MLCKKARILEQYALAFVQGQQKSTSYFLESSKKKKIKYVASLLDLFKFLLACGFISSGQSPTVSGLILHISC